ncbi:MAG: hypothetical protein RMJ84_10085 [Sandaracinaceae bacterium]|nr:hypothetical protein [Sandaracinaceae bacterium]
MHQKGVTWFWLGAWSLSSCGSLQIDPVLEARALGFELHPAFGKAWSRWGWVYEWRFLEVVWGTDEVNSQLPLVIALHGYGDTPTMPGHPFAGRSVPYRLVMPEAPLIVATGRAWSRFRVADNQPEAMSRELAERVEELRLAIALLQRVRPTRGLPILFGYSQGAHLALAFATTHPKEISGAVVGAGWLPPSFTPSQLPQHPPRIWAVHGSQDNRVPWSLSRVAYQKLQAMGWPIELHLVEGEHLPSPAMQASLAQAIENALRAIN